MGAGSVGRGRRCRDSGVAFRAPAKGPNRCERWFPPAGRGAHEVLAPGLDTGAMALLDWQSKFDLGVAAMDREHRELVAAMNRVHELDRQKAGKAPVDAAIGRLLQLTVQHFADEEKHMAAIGFPGLAVHARIHADMLKKMAAHHATFQRGDGSLSREFFDFLVLWLSAHIQGIDRKYASHPAPVPH